MKYRSISLNNNDLRKTSLVRYKNQYLHQLESLKGLDRHLVENAEVLSKIYSEESDHQSYMLFKDDKRAIGIVEISNSCDEKKLNVKVQIDESKLYAFENVYQIVDQLIDNLGEFFYENETIEINLYNLMDLSLINDNKYQKCIYSDSLITYICQNKSKNALYQRMTEEISETEKNLKAWNQVWLEDLEYVPLFDLHSTFDETLINEYGSGLVPYSRVFYKVDNVYWNNIKSQNAVRNISFSKNGQIEFDKKSNKYNGINYNYEYNILGSGFKLNSSKRKKFTIDENDFYTEIKTDNLIIKESKEDGRKKIVYKTPRINRSTITIELHLKEEEIKKCYVYFQTYKNDQGKMNGYYLLKIISEYCDLDRIKLNFISRKGNYDRNLISEIESSEKELFTTILEGKITYEIINDLINKLIPIINKFAEEKSKQQINLYENLSDSITSAKEDIIKYIKEIKGEIPLPELSSRVEEFVMREQSKKISSTLKKKLKKYRVCEKKLYTY